MNKKQIYAYEGYPVTRVRVWRGDTLLWEVLLLERQETVIPHDIDEPYQIETTPFKWQGEGTLKALVPALT